jgi:hypothetical protein
MLQLLMSSCVSAGHAERTRRSGPRLPSFEMSRMRRPGAAAPNTVSQSTSGHRWIVSEARRGVRRTMRTTSSLDWETVWGPSRRKNHRYVLHSSMRKTRGRHMEDLSALENECAVIRDQCWELTVKTHAIDDGPFIWFHRTVSSQH